MSVSEMMTTVLKQLVKLLKHMMFGNNPKNKKDIKFCFFWKTSESWFSYLNYGSYCYFEVFYSLLYDMDFAHGCMSHNYTNDACNHAM